MKEIMACALCVAFLLAAGPANALKVGDKVTGVKVRDGDDKPATIPDLGKKVLTIFYTDPDEKEMNEKFREDLKAAKLNESKYRGMGVVNMKDTWKPNFLIRRVVRSKIKKFRATILTDKDHTLKKAWKLGDCNEKDVVIVIGTDKVVKFIKKTKLTATERKAALALVKRLIGEQSK